MRYTRRRIYAAMGGKRMGREGGLSLLEIMVGLAILALALVGIYGVVSQSVRSFGVSEDFLEVQQNARVGLGKLGEEAKWAQAVQVSTAACPSGTLDSACLSLQIPAENPLRNPPAPYQVSFRWNGGAQQLERVEGGTTTPLADHVTLVTFQYLDAAGDDTTVPASVVQVIAELRLERGDASERIIGSDVFLRNAPATPGPPGPTPPPPTVTPTRTWTPTPAPTLTRTWTPTPPPTWTPSPAPTTPTPPPTPPPTRTPTVTPKPR